MNGLIRRLENFTDLILIGFNNMFHGKLLANFAPISLFTPTFFLEPALSGLAINNLNPRIDEFLDPLREGFLWGVPKKRRTVEKRCVRRLGVDRWGPPGAKLLKPKLNLIVCQSCGNHHEKGYLCPTCYEKVEEETKLIQKAMDAAYKMKKIDFEIDVRYKKDGTDGDRKNVEFIEIEKERPAWFSKSLLTKSNE